MCFGNDRSVFLLGVCMQAGGGLYLGLSEYRLHVAFMFASFGEMEIGGGGGGTKGDGSHTRWQWLWRLEANWLCSQTDVLGCVGHLHCCSFAFCPVHPLLLQALILPLQRERPLSPSTLATLSSFRSPLSIEAFLAVAPRLEQMQA